MFCQNQQIEESCICDYSSFESCGFQVGNCFNQTSCENSKYCSEKLNWTTLRLDSSPVKGIVGMGEYTYFRFIITTPCAGVLIDLQAEFGDPDFYVSKSNPEPTKENYEWMGNGSGGAFRLICPVESHPVKFTPGTYYIGVFGKQRSKYGIQVRSAQVPLQSKSKSDFPSFEGSTCIQDGETISIIGNVGEYYYFHFIPISNDQEECLTIGMSLITYESDADLFFTTSENPLGTQWNPDHGSMVSGGEETYATRICNSKKILNLLVVFWESKENEEVLFTVSTKGPFIEDLLISRYLYQLPYDLMNSLNMVCNQDGVDVSYYCISPFFGGCESMWPGYPSEEKVPVWPLPSLLRDDPLFRNIREPKIDLIPKNNSFVYFFLLQAQQRNNIYKTYGPGDKILDVCKFELGGKVVLKGGKALEINEPFQLYSDPCLYPQFKSLDNRLDVLFDTLKSSSNQEELETTRFEIDILVFSSVWSECLDHIEPFIYSKTATYHLDGKFCLNKTTDESGCCEINFFDGCCSPTQLEQQIPFYLEPNSEKVEEYAGNPECSESYLQDLMLQLNEIKNLDSLICHVSSTDSAKFSEEGKEIYQNCVTKYLGFAQTEGIHCNTDEECVLGENKLVQYQCDLSHNRCLIPIEDQEINIIKCMWSKFDSYIIESFKTTFHLSSNDTEAQIEFLSQLQDKDCSHEYILPLLKREYYFLDPYWTCKSCDNLVCVDQSCQFWTSCVTDPVDNVPWECSSQYCKNNYDTCGWYSWTLKKSKDVEYCENDKFCNWNECNGLSEEGCEELCVGGANQTQTSNFFCGYCEDGINCIEISNIKSKDECESKIVCRLSNGETHIKNVEEGCSDISTCTEKCPGSSCQTHPRSLHSSLCYGLEHLDQCDWNSNNSKCYYHELFNNPLLCIQMGYQIESCQQLSVEECSECERTSRNCSIDMQNMMCYVDIYRECLDEEDCTTNSGFCTDRDMLVNWNNGNSPIWGYCVEDFDYQVDSIELCGPQKLSAFIGCFDPFSNVSSQQQCDQTKIGIWYNTSRNEQQCLSKGYGCLEEDTLYTGLNQKKDCDLCNGKKVNYFTWKKGKWIESMTRNLQWKERVFKPKNEWKTSLNYTKLSSAVFESLTMLYGYGLQTDIFCQIDSVRKLIKTFLCDTQNGEDCFEPFDIGIAYFHICHGQELSLVAPPATLNFSNHSLQIKDNQTCGQIEVFKIPFYELAHTNNIATLGITFVSEVEQELSLPNSKNAFIGTFIGNGIEILSDSDLKNIEVCLDYDTSHVEHESYNVFDFSSKSKPLSINVYFKNESKICTIIDIQANIKNELIPILRLQDWENENALSDSEKTTFYFVSFFYFLLSLLSFIVLQRSYSLETHFQRYHKIPVCILVIIIGIIRGIYFSLSGDEVLDLENEELQGTLVQLPTWCYFSCLVMTTLAWASLYMSTKSHISPEQILKKYHIQYFIPVNIFLYSLLVVFIILSSSMNQLEQSSCGNRVEVEEDSQGDILLIIFQVLFCSISFGLLGFLIFFGRSLNKTIKSANLKGSTGSSMIAKELNLILQIYSISIISVSVFFIVYIQVDNPTPYASLAFILIEILPLMAVLLLMLPGQRILKGIRRQTSEEQSSGINSTVIVGKLSENKE